MTYNYYYTMDHLPTRYEADSNEWENRSAFWHFKDGNFSTKILNMLKSYVDHIVGSGSTGYYVICFIPASTRAKTLNSYGYIAKVLKSRTGVQSTLDAIIKPFNSASGHIACKSNDHTAGFQVNSECFRGKKVNLIEDAITRGTTFNDMAAKHSSYGAKSVTELFLAKNVYMNSCRMWA